MPRVFSFHPTDTKLLRALATMPGLLNMTNIQQMRLASLWPRPIDATYSWVRFLLEMCASPVWMRCLRHPPQKSSFSLKWPAPILKVDNTYSNACTIKYSLTSDLIITGIHRTKQIQTRAAVRQRYCLVQLCHTCIDNTVQCNSSTTACTRLDTMIDHAKKPRT